MFRFTIAALALLAPSVAAETETGTETQRQFCFEAPHDRLCPVFPEDQPDFSRFFEYRIVNDTAQAPFDEFAWQAFVSVNWRDVERDGAEEKPQAPGWRTYMRKPDIFGADLGACGDREIAAGTVIASGVQSDGNALIDQDGNFIVYETRLNPTAQRYLETAGLTTPEGQAAFDGAVDFPRGLNAAKPASALIKTAWRILSEDRRDMIMADGLAPISKDESADGISRCIPLRLGLIGMHIVTKVQSGNGDKWIWATFEHEANAPVAANAREINSLYARDLFPDGCAPPAAPAPPVFTLFDAECPACETNAPPEAAPAWASAPPYAVDASTGRPTPTSQVVRCWRVFGPTERTNAAWRAKLGGGPLTHYMLVSAQWRGANPDPIFPNGELPRYLSNVALETYVQTDPNGTCLGCHAEAVTSAGATADFTYLLR